MKWWPTRRQGHVRIPFCSILVCSELLSTISWGWATTLQPLTQVSRMRAEKRSTLFWVVGPEPSLGSQTQNSLIGWKGTTMESPQPLPLYHIKIGWDSGTVFLRFFFPLKLTQGCSLEAKTYHLPHVSGFLNTVLACLNLVFCGRLFPGSWLLTWSQMTNVWVDTLKCT